MDFNKNRKNSMNMFFTQNMKFTVTIQNGKNCDCTSIQIQRSICVR